MTENDGNPDEHVLLTQGEDVWDFCGVFNPLDVFQHAVVVRISYEYHIL